MRKLEADDSQKLRGAVFEAAVKEDIAAGLIPFFIVATLGTTNSCAFDRLDEIGPVGNRYDVWVHVDAAYAGSAFMCPEYRHLMTGVQHAESFNFNREYPS